MHARSRLRQGFTLIELMTAVAIIAILAALATTAMTYGAGRARVNNTAFDVAAVLSTTQLRALSRGTPHYVIIQQPRAGFVVTGRVVVNVLERPEAPPAIPDWNNLVLGNQPEDLEAALQFDRLRPDGTVETVNAIRRDRLVLATSTGSDNNGVFFLDLNSARLPAQLPPPFSVIPLHTPFTPPEGTEVPSRELLAGCSFCIDGPDQPYGVLRFNPDGTVEVLTGASRAGGTIAFAPNTVEERGFTPRLLTISAPAGGIRVF